MVVGSHARVHVSICSVIEETRTDETGDKGVVGPAEIGLLRSRGAHQSLLGAMPHTRGEGHSHGNA
jgi:hypothetical protein